MSLVRVQDKGQVTIPTRLRTQAGIAKGDLVDARFSRGKIILTPKTVIDRSAFPAADDEYTAEERRVIDARLKEARKGPYHGPFETADKAIKFLHKEIRVRKARRRKTSKS